MLRIRLALLGNRPVLGLTQEIRPGRPGHPRWFRTGPGRPGHRATDVLSWPHARARLALALTLTLTNSTEIVPITASNTPKTRTYCKISVELVRRRLGE